MCCLHIFCALDFSPTQLLPLPWYVCRRFLSCPLLFHTELFVSALLSQESNTVLCVRRSFAAAYCNREQQCAFEIFIQAKRVKQNIDFG